MHTAAPHPDDLTTPGGDMCSRPTGPHRGEDGFALVTVMLILTLLTGLTVVAHLATRTETQIGGNDYMATRSYYAAEAGAEHMLAALREEMSDGLLDSAEVEAADDDPPDIPGFTLADYDAEYVSGVRDEKITQGPFSGLWSRTREMLVTSQVQAANGSRTTVELNAKALAIPIFQFAAFYNEDLEIFPGAPMDLAGRVHTNNELYLGSCGGLDLYDVVTVSGDLHQHRKASAPGGEPLCTDQDRVQLNDDSWTTIDSDVHGFCGGSDPDAGCSEAQDENFVDYSKSNWDNNIQTRAHGIEPLTLPVPEGTPPHVLVEPCNPADDDAIKAVKYSCNANIDIRLSGTVLHVNGVDNSDDFATFQENQFYDDREQSAVGGNHNHDSNRDVVQLDLSRLEASEYGDGIIYVTRGPAGGTPGKFEQAVVRVVNGETLENPLTIATDLPMYVQGDYNSNDADWQPASLVADALTILSNAWDDADSWEDSDGDGISETDDETTGEDASPTRIQAAILAGHTATPFYGSPSPGGQFENFPRFLEDWGGTDATLVGSYVSLWTAQIAASAWDCCDYYGPPNRDWSFDERFKDPENLPPGTPVVGQILKIGFIRSY